jgi:hypothetical protein
MTEYSIGTICGFVDTHDAIGSKNGFQIYEQNKVYSITSCDPIHCPHCFHRSSSLGISSLVK